MTRTRLITALAALIVPLAAIAQTAEVEVKDALQQPVVDHLVQFDGRPDRLLADEIDDIAGQDARRIGQTAGLGGQHQHAGGASGKAKGLRHARIHGDQHRVQRARHIGRGQRRRLCRGRGQQAT